MKRRNVIVLLASGTVAVAALAVGKLFPSSNTQQSGTGAIPTAPVQPEVNPIVAENASFGTTGWQIPTGAEATTEIQAYVSARSITRGQSLNVYVSTQKEGTSYTLAIYRLGW